jgi:hypothetical protein
MITAHYDADYDKARTALSFLAQRRATERVKATGVRSKSILDVDGKPGTHDYWTQYYHEEIEKLCKERGLL